MRALITGIKGFTGQYVYAELVSLGWEVWGVGVQKFDDDPYYRCVDLNDLDELSKVIAEIKPEVVVHLAAISYVGHNQPDAFYKVNLIGTHNLLTAIYTSSSQLRTVLLPSSANVYGNSLAGKLTESVNADPANDYAVSKLSMEYMAKLWFDKLPIVITRPFNYTGVGQSSNFLIPKIVNHFKLKKESLELGNLNVWRDFSDVRTVAKIYRRLIQEEVSGKIVNVGSGKVYSLQEILGMIEELTGHSLTVKTNPAFQRANEVKSLCADITLLESLIGEFDQYNLNETLRWMLE